MSRPTWDEWGLELAATVARRADCTRRQVGAVIMTHDKVIVSTGYNGAAAGRPGCMSGACPRGRSDVPSYTEGPTSYDIGPGACIALHAEQNALLRASWDDMKGSVLYITNEPCGGCLRMIEGTPLARAVWPGGDWVWNRRN